MFITDTDTDIIYSGLKSGKFRYLGHGAGRHVYNMRNGYVVKLARNNFGYSQNRTEYELSQVYTGNLLAKVLSVSEGYGMLVMQAAKALHHMTPVLKYFNVETLKQLYRVPELAELASKYHLVMREFIRPRNWGLIDGRPVIIDYGIIWPK